MRAFAVAYLVLLALSLLVQWQRPEAAATRIPDASDAPPVVVLAAPDDPRVAAVRRALGRDARLYLPPPEAWTRGGALPAPFDSAHVVGVGPAAPFAARLARQGARSLTLVQPRGLAQAELLGDPQPNRMLHGLRLGAARVLHVALPHFGLLDRTALSPARARLAYDADPDAYALALRRLHLPTLVLGVDAAARGTARLVPHAQFFGTRSAAPAREFVARAEAGQAPTRAHATRGRLHAAAQPVVLASAEGAALILVVVLVVLIGLVSEDVATLLAGLLVAQGVLSFGAALVGSLLGVVIGDYGFWLIGHFAGQTALRRRPLRWIVRPEQLEQGQELIERWGGPLVALSRLVPGSRTPVYVGAGIGMTLTRFTAWFVPPTLVLTPTLVVLGMMVGRDVLPWLGLFQRWALPLVLTFLVLAALVAHLARRWPWGGGGAPAAP